MTDVVIVAIVAAIPATIGALVSLRNGQKSDEIHILVNSKMTAVKAELASANQRIESLEAMLLATQHHGDY